jgi:ketol-acid reductoisomerase
MKLHQIPKKAVQKNGDILMSESEPRYTKKAGILTGKKISVIGYDKTGQTHALNLRDSGFDVSIGVRPGKSWERASKDNFEVYSIADAVFISDVVSVTLPAEVLPRVYSKYIKNSLSPSKCLIFNDAACLNYGILDIPEFVNIFVVFTPKTGVKLRHKYLAGEEISSYTAPYKNPEKIWLNAAKEYAEGIGSSDNNFYETKLSEISCAQIFSGAHLSEFLQSLTAVGIKKLNEEISCSELSEDIIKESLQNAAEYKRNPEIRHGLKGLPGNREFEDKIGRELAEWIYRSKSGITFRESLLKNL